LAYPNRRLYVFLTLIAVLFAGTMLPGLQSEAFASPAGGLLGIPGVGTLSLPEWLTATEARGMENQPNAGWQYDLVGLSGDTWHYARLVSYRLEQNLGPAAMLFGIAEANPQILGELARPLLDKSLSENGGRILEWSPARKTFLGGRSVPMISARLIMTEKVPLPMSAKVYVFMQKEHLFALGVFAPDSDRVFWDRTFNQIAGQLSWEP